MLRVLTTFRHGLARFEHEHPAGLLTCERAEEREVVACGLADFLASVSQQRKTCARAGVATTLTQEIESDG